MHIEGEEHLLNTLLEFLGKHPEIKEKFEDEYKVDVGLQKHTFDSLDKRQLDRLAMDIKNKILNQFNNADIDIRYDDEQNEYFISTKNKILYDSEEYEKLIFEIKQEMLYGRGIFNFYLTWDASDHVF